MKKEKKKNNNIVFLDIDGVVNTIQISKEPYKTGNIKKDGYYFQMCHGGDGEVSNKQAVLWLDKLCHEANAKIVISSTWRKFLSLEEIAETLYNASLSRDIEVIDKTPVHDQTLLGLNYWKSRGAEIMDWLSEHPEIDNFVILDDDIDMDKLIDHLIQCDPYHGFGLREYSNAIDLLKK